MGSKSFVVLSSFSQDKQAISMFTNAAYTFNVTLGTSIFIFGRFCLETGSKSCLEWPFGLLQVASSSPCCDGHLRGSLFRYFIRFWFQNYQRNWRNHKVSIGWNLV